MSAMIASAGPRPTAGSRPNPFGPGVSGNPFAHHPRPRPPPAAAAAVAAPGSSGQPLRPRATEQPLRVPMERLQQPHPHHQDLPGGLGRPPGVPVTPPLPLLSPQAITTEGWR
eukprot:TRINITY_DN76_c5_g1_i1.p3 TRINITY_DN76_c5_g1~~TRINITY_DN76_c5_g1_i1.p3  ORF type:complete len:123 (+),score=14.76 TRINITY_DN76_c5_g1_i1:33-371(+)